MKRTPTAMLVLALAGAGFAATPAGAAARPQTLVFDVQAINRFLDKPPAGPSPGDAEIATGRLRDAAGRVVGTVHDRCVFTKVLANDVLERCTGRARTREGRVTLAGAGRLYSMNPPWRMTGRSGAYRGLRGRLLGTDISLDPDVALAGGRFFTVVVITIDTGRRLHVGVVPRPAANAGFIRRVTAACRASDREANRLPGFPFPSFDPFHPDPQLLPQVGRFFDQPARRRLPVALLRRLESLGRPPARGGAWRRVLGSRRALLANEKAQIRAALADDVPTFVRTVYRQSVDYNELVFRSAIFGTQSCTSP